jgi:protease I
VAVIVFPGTNCELDAQRAVEVLGGSADLVFHTETSLGAADAVIVPGGFAPDYLRRSPEMIKFVADLDKAGKPVGAICHAAWLLCSAEILKGRKATCFFAIKDDVIHAGAEYVDQEVVVDRNLVTSRKPDDLPAFMREFLTLLAGRK